MAIDAIVSYSDLAQARRTLIAEDARKQNQKATIFNLKCQIEDKTMRLQKFLDDQRDLAKRDREYKNYNYQNIFNQALTQLTETLYPLGFKADEFALENDCFEKELEFCLKGLMKVDDFLKEASQANLNQLNEYLYELDTHREEYPHLIDKHNRFRTFAQRFLGLGLLAGAGYLGYQAYEYLKSYTDSPSVADNMCLLGEAFGAISLTGLGAFVTFVPRPASFQHNFSLFKKAAGEIIHQEQEEKNYFLYGA
ncbi:MAG: hypothetical protein SFW66_06660 [Gammaproteobacteria bacterium]|nr:hypothetical protein [Gammaproteobacteria bacterium]